jgi:glycosyltransferase involved in cell wall biosynthesis
VEALALAQASGVAATVYGSRRVCSSGVWSGLRVVASPSSRNKYLGPVALGLVSTLRALVHGEYDVVHLHGTENGFLVPFLRLRFPVVLTSHGQAYRVGKWPQWAQRVMRAVEGFAVQRADEVTAVSRHQAEEMSMRYGRAVQYVPNGVTSVPSDLPGPSAIEEAYGLRHDGYWLMAAARIDPIKGFHDGVAAHARMAGSTPLVIVGDQSHAPDYAAKLRRIAGQGVRFLPVIEDRAVLLQLLVSARVFLFTSTVEAMSIMLLQALSVGAVAVVSDIPQNLAVLPEWVATYSAGDVNSLCETLSDVLALTAEERRSTASRSREWVAGSFGWPAIGDAYLRSYDTARQHWSAAHARSAALPP